MAAYRGTLSCMYSVIHAVILDPFPYKDPDHLMSVSVRGQRGGNGSYYPIDQFLDISERNTVFSGVVASTWSDVTWTDAGEPQRLRGNHCTMRFRLLDSSRVDAVFIDVVLSGCLFCASIEAYS